MALLMPAFRGLCASRKNEADTLTHSQVLYSHPKQNGVGCASLHPIKQTQNRSKKIRSLAVEVFRL
jgi:hypothetical protein